MHRSPRGPRPNHDPDNRFPAERQTTGFLFLLFFIFRPLFLLLLLLLDKFGACRTPEIRVKVQTPVYTPRPTFLRFGRVGEKIKLCASVIADKHFFFFFYVPLIRLFFCLSLAIFSSFFSVFSLAVWYAFASENSCERYYRAM